MKSNEAPRIISLGGWSAAVLAMAVFAISLGIFFYQKANTPILATEEEGRGMNGQCSYAKEQVAINNYPGKDSFSANLQHKEYEDLMGGNWRCSEICVPGYDNTKTNDPDNDKILNTFLKGATIGGNPINLATSKQFLDILDEQPSDNEQKGEKMMRTVIVSQAKKECEGAEEGSTSGGSVNYDRIERPDGGEVTTGDADKQITAQEQDDLFRLPTGSGSGKAKGLPTAQDKSNSTSTGNNLNDIRYNYATCIQKRYEYLNTFKTWLDNAANKPNVYYSQYSEYYNNYLKAYTAGQKTYGDGSKLDLAKATEAKKWCYSLADYEKTNAEDPRLPAAKTTATQPQATTKAGYTFSVWPAAKIGLSSLIPGVGPILAPISTYNYLTKNWGAIIEAGGDYLGAVGRGIGNAYRWLTNQ